MIQYSLLDRYPRFLRWYRTRITLDWKRLTSYLPVEGSVLDIGCGVGLVDYELAKIRPKVNVLGTDISARSIAMAKVHHKLPNVDFECVDLQSVQGPFDCVLLIDVLHHVHPDELMGLLDAASLLLSDRGYLLIKDIERSRGQISWFMDRFISGAEAVYLRNCDELAAKVARHMSILESEVHFRFPFPHCYIIAQGESK